MSKLEKELAWVAQAQELFEQAVLELPDLRAPSKLPGWSRGHVVTHVARNAEGLCRLLVWARTGVKTPMYPSVQARDADIEAGATRPHAEQLDDLRSTAVAFAAAAQQLAPRHWDATVSTRHGPVPASWIPWARTRELWLHLVDLDGDVQLEAIPEDIATKLIADLAEWMHTRLPTRVELLVHDHDTVAFGPEGGDSVAISGATQELAGWLAGRSDGERLTTAPGGLPQLPSWI